MICKRLHLAVMKQSKRHVFGLNSFNLPELRSSSISKLPRPTLCKTSGATARLDPLSLLSCCPLWLANVFARSNSSRHTNPAPGLTCALMSRHRARAENFQGKNQEHKQTEIVSRVCALLRLGREAKRATKTMDVGRVMAPQGSGVGHPRSSVGHGQNSLLVSACCPISAHQTESP